jgi:hypothetical protein
LWSPVTDEDNFESAPIKNQLIESGDSFVFMGMHGRHFDNPLRGLCIFVVDYLGAGYSAVLAEE